MPRQKKLSPEIIDLVVAGIDAKIRELEDQRAALLSQRAGAPAAAAKRPSTQRGRRKGSRMSEEARQILSRKARKGRPSAPRIPKHP
jgi:hypothetical protein